MKTLVSGSAIEKELTSIKWLKEPEFDGIYIVNPSGWHDYEHFYKKKISKDEFLLLLAKSEFRK